MSPHELIHGAAFDPETIELMSRAYDLACRRLGNDQPAAVKEAVAKRIIDSARGGERRPEELVAYALRGLDGAADTG